MHAVLPCVHAPPNAQLSHWACLLQPRNLCADNLWAHTNATSDGLVSLESSERHFQVSNVGRQREKDAWARLEADARLDEVDGGLEDVAPLRCHQLGQRPREEPRGGEAEAAVHGVGRQLQRLLPDVQLLPPHRVALASHQRLHLPPPLHQPPNDLQHVRICRSPTCVRLKSKHLHVGPSTSICSAKRYQQAVTGRTAACSLHFHSDACAWNPPALIWTIAPSFRSEQAYVQSM